MDEREPDESTRLLGTTDESAGPVLSTNVAPADVSGKPASKMTDHDKDGQHSDKEDDDDGSSDSNEPEIETPQPLTPELRSLRQAYLIALIVVAVIGAGFAAFALLDNKVRCSEYTVSESSCDAAGALIAHALLIFILQAVCLLKERRGFFDNKLPVTDVAHHVSYIGITCGIAKLWVYRWQHVQERSLEETVIGDVVVGLFAVTPFVTMYLNHRVHRVDIPAKVKINVGALSRILKPYFWPKGWKNRALILATWGLMGLGKAAGVIAPLFLAKAVNEMGEDEPDRKQVFDNIVIYGTLSLCPRNFEEIQDMLVVNIWRVAYVQVADETFRHVHSLSLEWHLKKRMGHVIRFMDRGMNAAQQLVAYVAMYMGPAVAVAIAAFIVFATEFNQPKIAAVTFLFMSLYGWITVVMTIWRKVFFEEANVHDNDMHDKATDSLVNFETVKYFTNEELEAMNYKESVDDFQRNEQRSRLSVAVLNMAQATVMEYCRVAALIIAAAAVIDHADGFNLGKFMALQAYLVMIFSPLQFLGSIYEMAVQSVIDMENLSDLLGERPDLNDAPDAMPLVPVLSSDGTMVKAPGAPSSSTTSPRLSMSVEFRDVRFRYPSQAEQEGIHDVNFTIPAGTTTAIVGTTGSGKTTVTRLLFRFYDVLRGSVLVGGKDVRHVTQKSLRQHIGIVPQDTVLFNDTVYYNISYGRPSATREEVIEAARQAQLLPLIDRLDKGWDTVVGERGLKLSGGEKQRVAIARCLLKNPPIVVLDEATSALDNQTEREIQHALQLLAGRTMIVIAHRLSTVQNADTILVMTRGRVVERGSFAELMANEGGPFHSMWHAQLRAAQGKNREQSAADGSKPENDDEGADAAPTPQHHVDPAEPTTAPNGDEVGSSAP